MASIGMGAAIRGRRTVNHDLPLIPFIDFLLCIVAFLLVTAVWSRMARLEADALAPSEGTAPLVQVMEPLLHVEPVAEGRFRLTWKVGTTVLSVEQVTAAPVVRKDGTVHYPDLAAALERTFQARGVHRAAGDARRDRAVLHTPNDTPFSEVVAVLDAIHSPQRTISAGGGSVRLPAFAVGFAVE
jgi:biopolymer transport protein ExbD